MIIFCHSKDFVCIKQTTYYRHFSMLFISIYTKPQKLCQTSNDDEILR